MDRLESPRMLALLVSAALAASTSASSVMQDADGKHPADLAADGLLSTGWAEGQMGMGEGSWVELDLGTATRLESVSFWPGNLKEGKKSFREYSRPKLVKVLVDGKVQGEPVRLQDQIQRVDVPVDVTGQKVRIEVVEVFEGMVFADLFVSEVAVNFTEGERAKAVAKVKAWTEGKEGLAVHQKYEKEVLAQYEAHKANSDDLPSLAFLMEAAGDGPEYLQKKVTTLVPVGYRAAAIEPDPMAMDAIRKLKDANGIPGLEMAALRAMGKQQREIRSIIDYFYAWQELQGGGRRNIDPWGQPGFEVGALQSFGEPLPIEIDSEGNAIVCDTGNNRVQRFSSQGVSTRQWGAEKDVVEDWFGRTRPWYPSGGGTGEAAGAFVNPVDVELMRAKEGDGMIVLDALGRVQVYDGEGRILIGWKVRSENQVQPKVGGEAYLAWVPSKKEVVVILQDEAILFNLEAEELGRFKIKDGTPNAVEVGSDNRLYLVFGGNVVAYNVDGFRYGTVIDRKLLGEGFEDVDLTVDEAGMLWVLTDLGWVYAFKAPGKLDWKTRVSDVELVHPRFAVFQGQVLLTDRDRILPVDALQHHTDEVQAEKEEAEKRKAEGADKKKKGE